jgi:hypothetical protein
MELGTRRLLGLGVIVLTSSLTVCGGKSNDAPGGASSPPPVGTATPTPPPTPLATPDTLFSCAIGDGSASSSCQRENPSFLNEVNTAIDQLVQQQPQIFDLGNALGDGGYKVLSPGQYYVGVMRNLQHMGFCANFDGEEMQVKNTNEFSDQYHIMISSGYVRRGSSSYRATCYPAAFPVGGAGLPGQRADCSLPPSREIACGREEPSYLDDVERSIDQLAQQQPGLFNLTDFQSGTDWFKVVNVQGYIDGMVAQMRAKGYCALWDGEELVAKKENRFTDHFDILTGDDHVRRGAGSYRVSCYPAAF